MFTTADAPPLPEVNDHRHALAPELIEEVVETRLVNTYRGDRPHRKS